MSTHKSELCWQILPLKISFVYLGQLLYSSAELSEYVYDDLGMLPRLPFLSAVSVFKSLLYNTQQAQSGMVVPVIFGPAYSAASGNEGIPAQSSTTTYYSAVILRVNGNNGDVTETPASAAAAPAPVPASDQGGGLTFDLKYCSDGLVEEGVPAARLRLAGMPADPRPLLEALLDLCKQLAGLTPNNR